MEFFQLYMKAFTICFFFGPHREEVMKEDPDKPRKMRRKEENDEAPGTPVNDVSMGHWLSFFFT